MRLTHFRPHLGRGKMMAGRFLGPELIPTADRDFSGGQGNWVVGIANGEVTFNNIDCGWNTTISNNITIAASISDNTIYRLGFEITAYTSGSITGYVGDYDSYGSKTSTGVYVCYGNGGPSNWLKFICSVGFVGSIDNISIKRCL